MEAVNVSTAEQNDLFQLVAGVLHLGDVDFVASEDGESSSLSGDHEGALQLASGLLGTLLVCIPMGSAFPVDVTVGDANMPNIRTISQV